MPRRFCIITMGCQMNAYDSDRLAQSLISSGLKPVTQPEKADLVLINTCTVRAKPEQKAYSTLGRMGKIKQRRPGLILGLVGCLAQQEGAGLLERFPQLDLVMGTRNSADLMGALKGIATRGERVVATQMESSPAMPFLPGDYFHGKAAAYLSIMEGCNNCCTYCIVPYVRGPEVSRDPAHVLMEARSLVAQGVKEITLLGQNVNSYQWGGEGTLGFPELLARVSRLDGLRRLRFTTSHPKSLSPQLIACFGALSNLCAHIHLPFQAGSNRVLQRMGRGYRREHYLELVDRLRSQAPHIAISSDVMVGFPGESRGDFDQTMDLVQRVEFDGLFSFKYSDRKGTVAARMGPKVPEREKAARLTELQELQKGVTLEKNKALAGAVMDVLVEGPGKRNGQMCGRTESNKIVNFNCNNRNIGNLVKVKIIEGLRNSLRGEVLSNPG
jgi:tRNA-2-methylthio-N6-dimethylallyladenosine synthase